MQAEAEQKRRDAYTATQGVSGGSIVAPPVSSTGLSSDERKPRS